MNDRYDVDYRCDCCDSLYPMETMSRPTGVWLGDRLWDLCPNCVSMVEDLLESHGPDEKEENVKGISEKIGEMERDITELKTAVLEINDGCGQIYADEYIYKPLPHKEPVVHIGGVKPLPKADLNDKEWPKKVLEEAAEVYSAWEKWRDDPSDPNMDKLRYECGDVIQTCVNMLFACSKEDAKCIHHGSVEIDYIDVSNLMRHIEASNREKGRYDG